MISRTLRCALSAIIILCASCTSTSSSEGNPEIGRGPQPQESDTDTGRKSADLPDGQWSIQGFVKSNSAQIAMASIGQGWLESRNGGFVAGSLPIMISQDHVVTIDLAVSNGQVSLREGTTQVAFDPSGPNPLAESMVSSLTFRESADSATPQVRISTEQIALDSGSIQAVHAERGLAARTGRSFAHIGYTELRSQGTIAGFVYRTTIVTASGHDLSTVIYARPAPGADKHRLAPGPVGRPLPLAVLTARVFGPLTGGESEPQGLSFQNSGPTACDWIENIGEVCQKLRFEPVAEQINQMNRLSADNSKRIFLEETLRQIQANQTRAATKEIVTLASSLAGSFLLIGGANAALQTSLGAAFGAAFGGAIAVSVPLIAVAVCGFLLGAVVTLSSLQLAGYFERAGTIDLLVGNRLRENTVHGEPHLETFDGIQLNFQAIGEFVLFRTPRLEVQQRYLGSKGAATSAAATAIRFGTDTVQILFDEKRTPDGYSIGLNGARTTLPEIGIVTPVGMQIRPRAGGRGASVDVITPEGDVILVENLTVSQNVVFAIQKATAMASQGGLLGVADGDPSNDLRTRDGSLIGLDTIRRVEVLYGKLAPEWRVRESERLFADRPAREFLTDEYTSPPTLVAGLSNFSSAEIAAMRKRCQQGSNLLRQYVDDCTYDGLVGGEQFVNDALASTATNAPKPISTNSAERIPDGPLISAAFSCRIDLLRQGIQAGENVNLARQSDGATALMVAAQQGCVEAIDILTDAGADLSAVDDHGQFVLLIAAYNSRLDAVDRLLKRGASVSQLLPTGDGPLMVAARNNALSVVNRLLSAGTPVDVSTDEGFTPLTAAAQRGFDQVVLSLLKAGADPNQRGSGGLTALSTAAAYGRTEVIKALLRSGAFPDLLGEKGLSPLHWAVQNGYGDVVESLLKAGANVEIETADDHLHPLHIAAGLSSVDMVRALVKAGASTTARDRLGRTPLTIAQGRGDQQIVDVLQKGS